jgi:hypothetical protein
VLVKHFAVYFMQGVYVSYTAPPLGAFEHYAVVKVVVKLGKIYNLVLSKLVPAEPVNDFCQL